MEVINYLKESIRQFAQQQKLNCNLYVTGSYGRNEQRVKAESNNSDLDILVVVKNSRELEHIRNKFKMFQEKEEISFIFCLKHRLESNPSRNYVLSTDFKNPIYKKFDITFRFEFLNVENRVNSQLQGTVYLVGKYVLDGKIVDLYKSLIDAVKTLIILKNQCLINEFIKLKDLHLYENIISEYYEIKKFNSVLNSILTNSNYEFNYEDLLRDIRKLVKKILELCEKYSLQITLDSINYFLANDLYNINNNELNEYKELKNLVHYENLGLSFVNTIETLPNNETKDRSTYPDAVECFNSYTSSDDTTINTLGPDGTDSQRATDYWKLNKGLKLSTKLYNTFDDVFLSSKKDDLIVMPLGFSDRRNNSDYKSWVDFHFHYLENIEVIDYFKLDTKTMVLLENKNYLIDKAIIHSSVYQLFISSVPNYKFQVEYADSKMQSFNQFVKQKFRFTLISEDCLKEKSIENVQILKKYNPTMMWIVYRVKGDIHVC